MKFKHFSGMIKGTSISIFYLKLGPLVQPLRSTSIRKIQEVTSELQQELKWVDIDQWFFFGMFTRPFGLFFHQIVAHLTWIQHQFLRVALFKLSLDKSETLKIAWMIILSNIYPITVVNHHKNNLWKIFLFWWVQARVYDFTSSMKFKVSILWKYLENEKKIRLHS